MKLKMVQTEAIEGKNGLYTGKEKITWTKTIIYEWKEKTLIGIETNQNQSTPKK